MSETGEGPQSLSDDMYLGSRRTFEIADVIKWQTVGFAILTPKLG
jgi:hypothetical protein